MSNSTCLPRQQKCAMLNVLGQVNELTIGVSEKKMHGPETNQGIRTLENITVRESKRDRVQKIIQLIYPGSVTSK